LYQVLQNPTQQPTNAPTAAYDPFSDMHAAVAKATKAAVLREKIKAIKAKLGAL
jgi:hypothetical protein